MDLASGYSDSINYGNGYTPLATGAINNNNASYAANQEYARLMGQYNPFTQSGGFGNMTDYYANMGAAYGRATGGFGGYGAANADPFTPVQSGYPSGDVQRGPDLQDLSINPFAQPQAQNQNPAVDWTSVFNTYTQPALSRAPQVEPYNPGSNSQTPGGWGQETMNNPDMLRLLGYTPNTPYSGGGIGSDAARTPNQPDPYQQWLQSNAPAAGGYGGGGIGHDRDALAWTLAQSSPYATPQNAPANGSYPNLGYNPGMANSFANPAMQQYDWTKNNDQLQQQMQDALKTIDGATGQKAPEPYGGKLPDFWQGVRDWTGMGAPQPIWQPSS
jgi:hypothetical protein